MSSPVQRQHSLDPAGGAGPGGLDLVRVLVDRVFDLPAYTRLACAAKLVAGW